MSKDTFSGDLGTNAGWLFNICNLCGGGSFGVGQGGLGFETRNRVSGSGPWTHARYATSNFQTGTWYYLAGVRESNVLYLYVNGILRATTPEPTPANLTNTAPLTFGGLTPASRQFFAGQLDEVDIYNRALSPSEVQAIFDAGSEGKCKVPPPPPNFQIGAIKAPAAAAPGATINVRDTTRNAGIGDAPASTTRIWLSTNKTLGIGDVELGARNVPELAAGAQDIATTPVTIPSGARGAYFLLLESDADDEAVESNEMDNIKAKAIGLGPDLTITSMVFDPSNPTSNTPTTIKLTVKNIGAEGASPSASRLYKSKNGKLDGADTLLAELPLDALAAGATATQSTTLTLPAGTYYVLAVSDAGNAVAEANETNNLKKTQKTVP